MGARFQTRLPKVWSAWSRRRFLQQAAVLGAVGTLPLSGCGSSSSVAQSSNNGRLEVTPSAGALAFRHGVASGDPLPDNLVLWTRITPSTPTSSTPNAISVDWLIASDPSLLAVVNRGRFITDAARDFTVKVEAGGLQPATTYYYQFSSIQADGTVVKSPIGRSKTAPTQSQRLRFASTSCAWLTQGFFNGYRKIAQRLDLDGVFTLGDYLYEYGPNDAGGTVVPGRVFDPPREMTSLADYRLRHANYKSDVDLQAAHRQHPWICTWDDHESTNDSHTTGAQNHTEGSEGVWSNRKRFSIQAYFEWMPVREAFNPLTHPDQHLYRRLRYGNLLDIFVLDTRLEGRDPPPANAAAASEANRRIMSNTQEQWLLNGLVSSSATWKLVAQQTMIGLLYTTPGNSFTLDAWDGYLAQRARLLDFIGGQNPSGQPIQNVVVITGDIHTAFATEVTKNPTDTTAYVPGVRGSVAVEFVCPSITSVGFPEVRALQQTNRHLRYAEASGDGGHGYNVLDITPQRCQSEWFFNATVLQPSDIERAGLMSVWKADAGVPYLSQGTASAPVANPPAAAP